MIALSLDRYKPFLMMPSCDCRVSVATGTSKLQVQSLPLCPESDGQSSKCGLSRWANKRLMHRQHDRRGRFYAASALSPTGWVRQLD